MKLIPWDAVAINGARCMIALLVYGTYLLFTRRKPHMNRWIALGAVAVTGTNLLFALANKMTTAANAIVLQYTAPIFVILLSVFFLQRSVQRRDLCACVFVFSGVIFFFLESLHGGHLAGDIAALISGLTYAVVFMLNDMPDGDPISSVFWGAVVSAVVGLPFLVSQPPLTVPSALSLLILGIFQTGFAFLCLTIGLRTTPPVTASLISGIEPILNPVLVALFYGEMLGTLSLIGAAIVIFGVGGYNVILARSEKEQAAESMKEK